MRRIAITVSIAAVFAATRLTLMGQAGPPPQSARDVIVVFHDDESDVDGLAAEHGRAYGASVSQLYHSAVRGYAARIPQARLDDVQRDPRVAFVSDDRPVQAVAQTLPTGVDRIDAELSSHCCVEFLEQHRGRGHRHRERTACRSEHRRRQELLGREELRRRERSRDARRRDDRRDQQWRRRRGRGAGHSRSTRSACSTTRAPAAGHRSFAASTG